MVAASTRLRVSGSMLIQCRSRECSRHDTEAAQRADDPAALRLLVLCLKSAIRFPAHARWLGRQWGTIKGAAPICTAETSSQPFGAIDCALICWLSRRGVHQALALPTSEIPPTVKLAAAATAYQARQPFPPAAKARGGICKRHELVDRDQLAVAMGDLIPVARFEEIGRCLSRRPVLVWGRQSQAPTSGSCTFFFFCHFYNSQFLCSA